MRHSWVPIKNDDPTIAGSPQPYDASTAWRGKKVVLVSVPGAFTPSCQALHLPPYLAALPDLRAQHGVDVVVFIASNDAWVMAAWGKVNGVKPNAEDFLMLSDTASFFAKEHGWMAGMGDRNGRWAMVIDKDGRVTYAENESDASKVTVSGVEAVVKAL